MKKYLDIVKRELKRNPEPSFIVKEVLGGLPERARDVAEKRFGISGEDPRTLEGIGKIYGITRERVRQIEASAFNRIRNMKSDVPTYPFVNILETIFREEGGVLSEEKLLEEFLEFENNPEINKRAIKFILAINEKFHRIKETEQWKPGCTMDNKNFDLAKSVVNDFIVFFESTKRTIGENELSDVLKSVGSEKYLGLDGNAIASFIGMSKSIKNNPFGQWGKKEWAEISPRGVRDKAYLVMLHFNEPRHFRTVTDKINGVRFGGRKAFSQTVHNELIKDDRFVLMGRGIYALRKDKSESDLIKGDIVRVIKNAKRPMSKDEIINRIIEAKNVKKSSVAIALQDSKVFKKTKENKYTLCSTLQVQP